MLRLDEKLTSATNLSTRDKIAQLIFVRIGSNLPPVRRVEEDEARIAALLDECPIGGLLLFNGGPSTRTSLEGLQSRSKVPLLVASDIERGVGQQVQGSTLFPHAMAFDKLGSNAIELLTQYAQCLAREAADIGIHIAFAPVADVNTNPKNPIIATRAYSETADRAAELTAAYVSAAETAGLLTTAKHFPGHGDTHQDSHDSLPSVLRTHEEFQSCELLPFQAAIDAGCSLVMTAHVAFPKIDPSGAPATLSPVLLKTLLRDKMGFDGAVCSDSLLMAGVRDRFDDESQMALATLTAGVDLLLDLREPARVIDYLCQCVDNGRLDIARVDEAFERVWALKQRMFNRSPVLPVDTSHAPRALAARVAKEAVEVRTGRDRSPLPFDGDKLLVAVLLKPFETAIDPPEQPLAAALREKFQKVTYLQIGPNTDAATYQSVTEMATNCEQLLVAMIVRPAAWHAFGLRPEQSAFLQELTQNRDDVVLASLGVPYALNDYPRTAVQICTYSDVPVSQQALVELLVAGP